MDRHELQRQGKHPAPCARHCEATAFEVELRRLRALLLKLEGRHAEFDDVEPAFPHEYKFGDGTTNRAHGMSLRDYFAAKAMQGLMARVGAHEAVFIAHDAYSVADAMLAARSKK